MRDTGITKWMFSVSNMYSYNYIIILINEKATVICIHAVVASTGDSSGSDSCHWKSKQQLPLRLYIPINWHIFAFLLLAHHKFRQRHRYVHSRVEVTLVMSKSSSSSVGQSLSSSSIESAANLAICLHPHPKCSKVERFPLPLLKSLLVRDDA